MSKVGKSIATLWPSIRISLVLVLITSSLILMADLLGITPNHTLYELEKRQQKSESLAVLFSTMAAEGDIKKVRILLSKIVHREDELLSAAFRLNSGKLLFEVGDHSQHWGEYTEDNKSSSTHVLVPISRASKKIGRIELKYKALASAEGLGIFKNPSYKLILFVFVFGFFSFLFFILRTLRQIDPSSVVPDRVNAAFDTLSEGVVILDDGEQIVLANGVFCKIVKRSLTALLGFKLSELNWKGASEDTGEVLYPWLIAMSTGEKSTDDMLVLEVAPNDRRTMTVNCAPIKDSQRNQQGILITFDDVTEVEMQKQQLQVTVSDLKISEKENQRKTKELHYLATRDPLTGCLNRRSFNELFAESFNQARSQNEHLTCLMVDIDHFKKVNDNYGHGVGDEVIILLANILLSSTREEDIVSRYGGEEFCIILPGLDVDEAVSVAERIRLKIKEDSISTFGAGPRVTASLGVSSIHDNAKDPAELNEQADQALYVAKESGRNRVISWTADSKTDVVAPPQPDLAIIEEGNDSDNAKHVEEVNQLQLQIKQLENAAIVFSDQLQREQNYDNLTGLPNQALFYDRIKQSVERSVRQKQITAILIMEVDLLSQANNSFGMQVAEKMFSILTDRIVSIFRKTDSVALFNLNADDLTISRFDGDEFGILLADLNDQMIVTWTVKRIIEEMAESINLEDKEVNVSCKIGISIYPEDADSPEELFSHASTAKSFVDKDNVQSGFQFYDSEMQKISLKQLGLEREIKRAINNEEWILYYQPKLDISSNKIVGVEALIRWNHPERGILSPFEFIDFAEERGLINEIGGWVIRTACKQVKTWSDKGFDIKVSVNLSAVQLRQEKFSNQVLEIIKESGIKPQQLELEVTETILMNNVEIGINTLNRLHCRGVSVSIDDFGTGYSSLGYLKKLPIDSLKIDRGFITDVTTDEYDKNIVNTIISLAHGLELLVVAEGVETQEQFNLLQEMSCDEIQGYLLSKPVDEESIIALLEQQKKVLS